MNTGRKEAKWWFKAVRRQEGEEGWMRAQESEESEGCAEDVIGLIAFREGGRGLGREGNSIGDIKGLFGNISLPTVEDLGDE